MNQIKIPSHWKLIKLGDYSERPEYGYTASATQKNSEYKFLRITDIQDGSVKWDNVPYCEINDGQIQKYILSSGDIVVARIGATTGKSFLINNCPKSLFASYLIRIRTKDGLLSEFLNFYFDTSTYWQQINANKGGRLKGGVNIPIIQSLIIPLPPLDEQRAIAHTLRTIQKSKEARQKELELERERKAALMEHLFKYGTKNESRKQTKIGEIPESWDILTLGEIITLQRGKDLPSSQRITGDIPIIGSNGLVGYHNHAVDDIPVPGLATGRSGSIGFLTYMDLPYHPLNTVLYVSDFKGNNPLFLYYWLHLFDFKKYASGVSVPTLNRNMVHPVPFPLPKYSEQIEIAHILKLCDRKIQALEKEISLIDELFHATLEELMTGRLTTTNCFQ